MTRESNNFAVAEFRCLVTDVCLTLVKMSFNQSISARQANREHVLAVSRDFISQPRLSKYIYTLYLN